MISLTKFDLPDLDCVVPICTMLKEKKMALITGGQPVVILIGTIYLAHFRKSIIKDRIPLKHPCLQSVKPLKNSQHSHDGSRLLVGWLINYD